MGFESVIGWKSKLGALIHEQEKSQASIFNYSGISHAGIKLKHVSNIRSYEYSTSRTAQSFVRVGKLFREWPPHTQGLKTPKSCCSTNIPLSGWPQNPVSLTMLEQGSGSHEGGCTFNAQQPAPMYQTLQIPQVHNLSCNTTDTHILIYPSSTNLSA